MMKARFAERFRTRTRDEWCSLAAGTNACLAPVLTLSEAPRHPHHLARGTFVEVDGFAQPAPMPFFERTPPGPPTGRPRRGEHTISALLDWGLAEDDVMRMIDRGAICATSAHPDEA
jgi:alpha-methylacyl-CoA racemase